MTSTFATERLLAEPLALEHADELAALHGRPPVLFGRRSR